MKLNPKGEGGNDVVFSDKCVWRQCQIAGFQDVIYVTFCNPVQLVVVLMTEPVINVFPVDPLEPFVLFHIICSSLLKYKLIQISFGFL